MVKHSPPQTQKFIVAGTWGRIKGLSAEIKPDKCTNYVAHTECASVKKVKRPSAATTSFQQFSEYFGGLCGAARGRRNDRLNI
jgi:hypothetical protein